MIILACIFLGLCLSIALVTVKKTMIDNEPAKNTPGFIVSENGDGDQTIHPLH